MLDPDTFHNAKKRLNIRHSQAFKKLVVENLTTILPRLISDIRLFITLFTGCELPVNKALFTIDRPMEG